MEVTGEWWGWVVLALMRVWSQPPDPLGLGAGSLVGACSGIPWGPSPGSRTATACLGFHRFGWLQE